MILCLCFLLFFSPLTLHALFLSVSQEQTQVVDPPSTQHVPVSPEPPRSLSQNSLRRCKNTQETLSFLLSYSPSPVRAHTKTHVHAGNAPERYSGVMAGTAWHGGNKPCTICPCVATSSSEAKSSIMWITAYVVLKDQHINAEQYQPLS